MLKKTERLHCLDFHIVGLLHLPQQVYSCWSWSKFPINQLDMRVMRRFEVVRLNPRGLQALCQGSLDI